MFNWRFAEVGILRSLLIITLTQFSLSSAKISFYNRDTKDIHESKLSRRDFSVPLPSLECFSHLDKKSLSNYF